MGFCIFLENLKQYHILWQNTEGLIIQKFNLVCIKKHQYVKDKNLCYNMDFHKT